MILISINICANRGGGQGDTVKPQIYIIKFALSRFYALLVQSLPNDHTNMGMLSLDLMFPNFVFPELTLNFPSPVRNLPDLIFQSSSQNFYLSLATCG
jgi:hypothetical protein